MSNPYTSDLAAKDAMAAYIVEVLYGESIPSGWKFIDVDPGAPGPTDPPEPDPDDLDTVAKLKDHTLLRIERAMYDVTVGHPGS